jgi:hypothetical protein
MQTKSDNNYFLRLEKNIDLMAKYMPADEIAAMRDFNMKLLKQIEGDDDLLYLKLINSFMDYLIIRQHYVENDLKRQLTELQSN